MSIILVLYLSVTVKFVSVGRMTVRMRRVEKCLVIQTLRQLYLLFRLVELFLLLSTSTHLPSIPHPLLVCSFFSLCQTEEIFIRKTLPRTNATILNFHSYGL